MIANCSYYRPMRKAFNWLTEIKKDGRFGFRLITTVQSDPDLPMKFNDVWNHQAYEQQKSWREANNKGLKSMNKQYVWNIIRKKSYWYQVGSQNKKRL